MKTRAPLRISFAGGGTDIEPYASIFGGVVISAAIQMYAYAEYPSKLHESSELERTIARHFDKEGSKLTVTQEALPMSGLGGSASCFVAGIKAINPEIDNKTLVHTAFHLERYVMGVMGGKQDQWASAFGGLNYMKFDSNSRVEIEPLSIPPRLEDSFLLVYMGERNHNGHDIIKDQMGRDNLANFNWQKRIVASMLKELDLNSLSTFGSLIEMAWQSKLQFSPFITTNRINRFHDSCLNHGAIAGKLTGAGGGGYMLLMKDPDNPDQLAKYLDKQKVNYSKVKFDIEGVKCL